MTGAPAPAALAVTRSRGGSPLPAPTAGDVLRRHSTANDVLRFLTDDVPRLVLASLDEDLPRGASPARARVTRAKLKPGRKLTVSVDVTVDGIPRRPGAVTCAGRPGDWAGMLNGTQCHQPLPAGASGS